MNNAKQQQSPAKPASSPALRHTQPPHNQRQVYAIFFANHIAKAPLLPAALGLTLGVLINNSLPAYPLTKACGLLLLLLLSRLTLRKSLVAQGLLLLAATIAGCLLHDLHQRLVPPDRIDRVLRASALSLTDQESIIIRLRGTVITDPISSIATRHQTPAWSSDQPRTSFIMRVTDIVQPHGIIAASGRIRVVIADDLPGIVAGNQIEALGWLRPLKPATNPGQFDWSRYYLLQGIVAQLHSPSRDNLQRIPSATSTAPSPTPAWHYRIRPWLVQRVRALLTGDFPPDARDRAELLETMLLGLRRSASQNLQDTFRQAGIMHLLAVSGVNVAMVMGCVAGALRFFRPPPWVLFPAMLTAVWLYAFIADPRPPILRAAITATMYICARWMNRGHARINWVAAAAILLILLDPASPHDTGFQLTFAALLGVLYLHQPIYQLITSSISNVVYIIRHRSIYPQVADAEPIEVMSDTGPSGIIAFLLSVYRHCQYIILTGLSVGIGSWLMIAPIAASHFNTWQPWGAVSTVVAMPVVALIETLGLSKLLLGLFSPMLASVFILPLQWLTTCLIGVAMFFAHLPGAEWSMPSPPIMLITLWYSWLAAIMLRHVLLSHTPLLLLRRQRKAAADEKIRRLLIEQGYLAESLSEESPPLPNPANVTRWLRPAQSLSGWLLLGGSIVWIATVQRTNTLTLVMLDVGAGSAMVVHPPDSDAVIVDAGSTGPYDPGQSILIPYLRSRGITKLSSIYISHADYDHYSGVPTLAAVMPPMRIFVNECFHPSESSEHPVTNLISQLHQLGLSLSVQAQPADTHQTWGEVSVTRLWPITCHTAWTSNDQSDVFLLSWNGWNVLISGDIEELAQQALIDAGLPDVDVLIMPHHGSPRSNTADFIAACRPEIILCSSSQRDILHQRGLQEMIGNARFYNTADHGAITVTLTPSQVSISHVLKEKK